MPSLIVITIILGIAAGVMTVFLLRSHFAPARIATISQLIDDGKTAGAIRAAKQLAARDQRNSAIHYLLVRAYLLEGRPEAALGEVNTINELATFGSGCPEPEFRRLAGELYERLGHSEEALKEHLMLVRLEPDEAEHYYNAGRLFEERKPPEFVAGYYQKALELDGGHAGAHFRLGVILFRKNLSSEAKVELESAVQADPQNHHAWFYLGLLLKQAHDYPAALSAFSKAERENELKVRALIERGNCYMQEENLDNAAVELERAVRLASKEKSRERLLARYLLSLCYEKSRRFEEAVDQWEQIHSEDPVYRDVGQKLEQFQALRINDRMKDYLTANDDAFQEICRAIVGSLGMQARDVAPLPNGCQVIAVNDEGRRGQAHPMIVRFLRAGGEVSESVMRTIYDEMKKLSVRRSVVVASSEFSREAAEFGESRPIDMIDRTRLQELLTKAHL